MTNASSAGEAARDVLSREEMRLLVDLGFVACGQGHTSAARSIFEGLRELRPNRFFPYFGLATARLSAGDPEGAIQVLRDGLAADPESEELQVLLGLSLHKARRSAEAVRVLAAVLARPAPDSPERRLARTLLADIEGVAPAFVSMGQARSRPWASFI